MSSGAKYRTGSSTDSSTTANKVHKESPNPIGVAEPKKVIPEEQRWSEDRLAPVDEEIEKYKASHNGRVPSSLLELLKSSGRILSFVDGWGSRFLYKASRTTYVLSSSGADKQFGTHDDIISKRSAVSKAPAERVKD